MRLVKIALVFASAVGAAFCLAQTLPPGFSDTFVVANLDQPDAITFTPDGRLLICEKTGALKSYLNGSVTTELTLNVSSDSERGLLGIALDPDFAHTHYVYLYYTTSSQSLNPPATPKNRVSRFVENYGVIDPASEHILLDLIPSDAGNHNGGALRFAPDGKLYIAVGDGGQFHTNAQTLDNLRGKVLRLNRDGSIPTDNPFYNQAGKRAEIYCYGLRNPFRFNLKPGTNTLFIGDVGQNTWEEIDVGQAGGNYGWPNSEGPDNVTGYIAPIFYYQHNQTDGSGAIIGGCFVTSLDWPQSYYGTLIYGDYVRSQIGWVAITNANTVSSSGLFETAPSPVDFWMGTHGGLYYPSISDGQVRVIKYQPAITAYTSSLTSTVGGKNPYLTITLDVPAPVGGQTITLRSSNRSVISVPTSVKIPANQTSANFYVSTHPVASVQNVAVSADSGSGAHTVNIQIVPPHLVGFSVAPGTVASGGYAIGYVRLDGVAPTGGISFTDASGNSSLASVSGSGLVPAGSAQGSFQVNSGLVSTTQTAYLTVTQGANTRSAPVSVTADPSVAGLAPESHTIANGQTMWLTVALAKKWTSPITINLSTDTPSALSIPAQITIPAGQIANAVHITGLAVSQNTPIHVYATLANVQRSNYMTVTP